MLTVRTKLVALLVFAVALAGCGGSDPDAETAAADATPGDGGGAQADGDDGDGGDVAPVVDEPVRVGFASADQPAYGAMTLAIAESAEAAVPMEAEFFQESELAMQALLQGEVDALGIGVNGPMIAINEGADLVTLAVTIANDWVLVTTTDITSPEDLDGAAIAIHSEVSTGTPLVRGTLDDAGVEAEFLTIPGSPNRAQAMTQGQVNATPLFLSDAISLSQSAPDRFHVLLDYADVPFASQTVVTTRGWLEENRDVAVAMVEQFVTTARRIADDTAWATEELVERFPDDDPAYLEELVQQYTERGFWVTDGGEELFQAYDEAIAINVELGTLEADASQDVDDYLDTSVLEEVLAGLD